MRLHFKSCLSLLPLLLGLVAEGAIAQSVAQPTAFAPNQPILLSQLPNGRQVVTQKSLYAPNESVVVNYANLPGNSQDWITIVPAGDPDDSYDEWFYTGGRRSGSHQFNGLSPGNYEVRVYHNWPNGGYVVRDRYRFSVSTQKPLLNSGNVSTGKTTYRSREPIVVNYANLPGNSQDWITIVPAGNPDDSYDEWFYTGGQRSGSRQFNGLGPGNYEVRVYHNWPSGGYVVQDRYAFTVR